MGKVYSKPASREDIEKMFKAFDKDGSGAITVDEFYKIMRRFNFSKQKIEDMVRKVDVDGNNEITLDGRVY